MTLITYLTRAHFADGVLEEALRSELESNEHRRPLIIASPDYLNGVVAERFFSGFPIRTSAETFSDVPSTATEAKVQGIAERFRETDRDALIAFGGEATFNLAKAARIAIGQQESLKALSHLDGGSRRIGPGLPAFYAVPGISGVAAATSAHACIVLQSGETAFFESRHLMPTVSIFDPTLTMHAAPAETASAGAGTIARSVGILLTPKYNPPADGLAFDGLSRTIRNLHRVVDRGDFSARREMMAGSLNSALALQKGLGVFHAVTAALEAVVGGALDAGAIGRLLLPGMIRFNRETSDEVFAQICDLLEVHDQASLADGFEIFLRDLPLPTRLSDMGIGPVEIDRAATLALSDHAISDNPRSLSRENLLNILEPVL